MKTVQLLESSKFDLKKGGKAVYLIEGKEKEEELLKPKEVGLNLPFKFLNPLQSVFFKHYEGGNALISSPTSSGKSLISLLFYLKNQKGRFIYTAPTRSLIWEKFREFKGFFGSVGVRSGDVVEELQNISQKAVVATYESLVAAARNRSKWFEEAGALVIDEVHVIRDESRGAIIEELVSYALEEGIPLLALSATVPGALSMAKWIEAELFIDSRWRPVPLERRIYNLRKLLKKTKSSPQTPQEKIVSALEALDLKGKTLVFLPRKDLGWQVLEVENAFYGKEVVNETLPFEVQPKKGEKVAFHNADVPQQEREKIEEEFRDGELNRLYATQTLAYGVNLPADSVVIFVRGRFDRFSLEYKFFPDLLTILQMEGRAGRLGLSEKGFSHIVITGAKEDALEKALKEEMESSFKTALSQGLTSKEGAACQNRKKSILSLMLLGPALRYGSSWKKAVKDFYSVRENPLLLKELELIVEELKEMGFIEGDKPTSLTKLLVSSFVSPYCFVEFLKRLKSTASLREKEPTAGYLFTVRPFLRKELNPKTVALFTKEAFTQEGEKIRELLEEESGIEVNDNSEVLIFYGKGSFFDFKNIARPPGELSTLSTESSLLGHLLCKLNLLDFEVVHRVIMTLRGGIPFNFSLLASVDGLGYMRGNALARVGKLVGAPNETSLINAVKEEKEEVLEALKEVLAFRYPSLKVLEKEFNQIVNIVKKVKFPLGNERLLKFLSSIFIGREKALKIDKEKALEVLRENVKGEEEV